MGRSRRVEGEQFREIMNQKINKHHFPTSSFEDGEGLAECVEMAEERMQGQGPEQGQTGLEAAS